MQKVNKKFDQTNQIISKITQNKRKRPRDYFHNAHKQIELPVIQNTLYTCKQTLNKRNQIFISNPANKKLQKELDNLINGALKNFKNQRINKVIFANTLTQKICLGKTYYKSSRYSTVDSELNSFYSLETRKNLIENRQRYKDVCFTPIRINQQTNFVGRTDFLMMKSFTNQEEKYQEPSVEYSQEIKEKPRKVRINSTKDKIVERKGYKQALLRFSPWNNNEGQDEIL